VVWGGVPPDDSSTLLNDGAFYDPESDSWQAIPTAGAPQGGGSIALYWVADRLVVRPGGYGGVYFPEDGWQALTPVDGIGLPHVLTTSDGRMLFVTGLSIWMLDVATATWLDSPTLSGAPAIAYEPSFFDAVWTGSTLLLWGSSVPQTCVAPAGVSGCDLAYPYLPAGEGVMVRLE
jgi:hypothetical protein